MDATLDALLQALAALGLATGVTRSSIVYTAVSASHVLGIALLLGPIVLADIRLLGGLKRLDDAALGILRRTAMIGVGLTVITGVLLLSTRPFEYAGNIALQAKLVVIAAALVNALAFEARAWARGLAAALEGRGAALVGLASIALWLTALMLGRWIAFVE